MNICRRLNPELYVLEVSLKHKHLLMHVHTHTCIHTYMCTCTAAHVHNAYECKHMNAPFVHTHVHTITYKHMCTYIHTHMLTIKTHVHTHMIHTHLLKETDTSFTCSLEFCDNTNLIMSIHFYGVYLQPYDKYLGLYP